MECFGVLALILPHLMVWAMLPRRVTVAQSVEVTHKETCRGCGYSLQGLARELPCPECGARSPSVRERVVAATTEIEAGPLRYFVLSIPVWGAWAVATWWWIPALTALWIHRHEGFFYSSALAWTRRHGGGMTVAATCMAAMSAPWTALLPTARLRWSALAVLLAGWTAVFGLAAYRA